MKKYTQEEFDRLPVENGIKICPTGDYSEIKRFDERCRFGAGCRFGEWRRFDMGFRFGSDCRFGACCCFGEECSFGSDCRFDSRCSFGKGCRFGEWCSFDSDCSFGEWCRFGKCCRFGEWCSFGGCCIFGKGCICEFGEFYHMTAHGGYGSRNRTTYFFGLTDGRICVRCGCFAGTIQEWEAKVKETHGDSYLARAYLALIPPVEIMMEGKREETSRIQHGNG